ncbi:DUF262 domain-containing protein [Cellulomonas sp. SLBN-39]|uniref:DUF262 domain-containing protein n=1 Tax=Cellulomonas sp. SLBN-39 TaxID=2768446 RepID=UPI001153B992|nr:DUF262 domain-containing protein [Cellulomonas sp. SLBN-39]TQL01529.1 uncharacterized protein DUF1524 [Cellulomonas sp. SLBN-39]
MQAKETTVQKMLSGTKVFLVPLFQRRYKWGGDDWKELWEDLVEQYDNVDVVAGTMRDGEGHFLGSIVLHPAPGPASTVTRYLVIDGQQRLTTLMLLLAVVRDERRRADPLWRSEAYDHQFLTNPYNPEQLHKLVPTARDREAFRKTLFEGEPTGQPGRAYSYFTSAIRGLARRDGQVDFGRLEIAILLRLLIVDITTSPGDNVNHIFHTLNHAGQKLSPLDLVRNRFFMSLNPDIVEEAHTELWQPMEVKLGETEAQRYLWAQVARTDAKATQKDLYPAYERRLDRLSGSSSRTGSATIARELERLHRESWLYAAVIDPPPLQSAAFADPENAALPAAVLRRLHDLAAWGSSTHISLTLELLSRHAGDLAETGDVAEALDHVLSFMVRRAICAIPTNNLNRILTGIPPLLNDGPLAPQLARLLAADQRYWPTDEEVRERAISTPLYATAQTTQVKFILERIEWATAGSELVDTRDLQVEHVMPQRISDDWRDYLMELGDIPERTYARVHTLGNLTLTGYNPELGRRIFPQKRALYLDSLVRLSVDLTKHDQWTEREILARSRELAEVALRIWTRPALANDETEGSPVTRAGLAELLTSLPEDAWTTLGVLAEYYGVPLEAVWDELSSLPPVLAVKVLEPGGRLLEALPKDRSEELVAQLAAAGYQAQAPIYETPALTVAQLRAIDAGRWEADGASR